MKNCTLLWLLLSTVLGASAQVVSTVPAFPSENDSVLITFDATKGTAGLQGYTGDVYVHTGVITNLSTGNTDWKHVFTTWGQTNPAWKMTRIGTDLYTYKVAPSVRSMYSVSNGETALKMAFVFRSGDGSKEAKDVGGNDIFINLYASNSFNVQFTSPSKGVIKNVNDAVSVSAVASTKCALTLYENGIPVSTLANDSVITWNTTATTAGKKTLIIAATKNAVTKYDTLTYVVYGGTNIATVPAGVKPGINYLNDTTVTLCIIAPFKNFIYVVGDFTAWYPDPSTLMNKDPGGKYFWVTITGLSKGVEYGYQYYIDGSLYVADPFSDKILDPWNDKYIPGSVYPNLKTYPTGKTSGIVSVLQTGQTPFNWQYSTNFYKPWKQNLNVYELLVRDFHQNHTFKVIADSIEYLKRMGINALELMPFNEFEGNESWGYNPDFYFAVDKAYGTKNDLKSLVDKCHQNGIAVIMDIVLNHSFGLSPMVQMYFNGSTGKVTAQNPWYNVDATHPLSPGYDFNHESVYTQQFVDSVLAYWTQVYNLDGFRFDLSKGFTQKNTGSDISAWSQYDASRVNILQRMLDKVKTYSPYSYMILEHLGDNSEEKELANRGFMLWGKMTDNYNQCTMGYSSNSDLSWGSYKTRAFNENNLVQYMESHDEERLMYKNLQYGNSAGSYLIKDSVTALKRNAAAAAIFFTQPGPKMIWQFGELGYNFSINYCSNGTINNACRTDSKPIRWNYLQDTNRYNLYKVFGAMQLLHADPEFRTDNYEWYTTGIVKNAKMNGTNLKVNTIANFDVVNQNGQPYFQNAGWWYDYLSGDSINVTNTAMTFNLAPGEYHVFTSKRIALPAWITARKQGGSGISSQLGTFTAQLYPNPATGETRIVIPEAMEARVVVMDALGRELLETMHDFTAHKSMPINTSGWRPGVYFVEVSSAQESIKMKLIVQ